MAKLIVQFDLDTISVHIIITEWLFLLLQYLIMLTLIDFFLGLHGFMQVHCPLDPIFNFICEYCSSQSEPIDIKSFFFFFFFVYDISHRFHSLKDSQPSDYPMTKLNPMTHKYFLEKEDFQDHIEINPLNVKHLPDLVKALLSTPIPTLIPLSWDSLDIIKGYRTEGDKDKGREKKQRGEYYPSFFIRIKVTAVWVGWFNGMWIVSECIKC